MFGESNSASSVGPSRRGLWTGVAVGCLLLITAAVLVSGTVDGLNLFGRRLPDSTPNFPDPPKEPDPRPEQRAEPRPEPRLDARPADRSAPPISTRSTVTASQPVVTPAVTPVVTPAPSPTPVTPTPVAPEPRETPACVLSGFAAVLDPATHPIGTALARSLRTSDLRARIIDAEEGRGTGNRGTLSHVDIDRIMAGDASAAAGRFYEGTLLVAHLKTYVRQAVIDEAHMTEVGGTMDLAIVRNNCGTITLERFRNVSGQSVNETVDGGMRGLGEIFKEKIVDLVRKISGDR